MEQVAISLSVSCDRRNYWLHPFNTAAHTTRCFWNSSDHTPFTAFQVDEFQFIFSFQLLAKVSSICFISVCSTSQKCFPEILSRLCFRARCQGSWSLLTSCTLSRSILSCRTFNKHYMHHIALCWPQHIANPDCVPCSSQLGFRVPFLCSHPHFTSFCACCSSHNTMLSYPLPCFCFSPYAQVLSRFLPTVDQKPFFRSEEVYTFNMHQVFMNEGRCGIRV